MIDEAPRAPARALEAAREALRGVTSAPPRASAHALEAAREALRGVTSATAQDIEVVALALDNFAALRMAEERLRREPVFPDTEAGRALESYFTWSCENGRSSMTQMYSLLSEAMFALADRRAAEERERWAEWHEQKALEAAQSERWQYAEFHTECVAAIRVLDDRN
jgi:hypothetical protein